MGGPVESRPDRGPGPIRCTVSPAAQASSSSARLPAARTPPIPVAPPRAAKTGLALTNLRLRLPGRRVAAEQATLNARLEETVTALRRGMKIHERLTEARGVWRRRRGYHPGGPRAHRTLRDRRGPGGHQQAMAGLGVEAEPSCRSASAASGYSTRPGRRRSVWHDGRWLALARTREEILGILVLLDPTAAREHRS